MKAMTIRALMLLTLSLSACSALPKLSEVAPLICSYATNEEARAAALTLAERLPDGDGKRKALEAVALASDSADAACTLVKALEAKQPATPQ